VAIEIRTLGGLHVLVDGEEDPRLSAQPARAALLVFLSVEGDVSRDQVQALLWSRLPPDRARHSLNQALHLLRRELGEDWVVSEGNRLRVSERVLVDAREFEARAAGPSPAEALPLYQGHFLEGWHPPGDPEFEHWADRARLRFSRLHRDLRRRRLASLRAPDDAETALQVAREWVGLDPSEDEAQHALIESLARCGHRSEALEAYEVYETALERDDLSPLGHTVAMVRRIRAGEGLPAPVDFPAPDPNRVLAYPLENRTGDPSLGVIGRMTADWVTQGLARLDFLEVVPPGEIMPGGGAEEVDWKTPEASDLARRLARETRTGTLVTGAYYLNGGELEFNLQVMEGPEWNLLQTLGPIRGSPEDPVAAVDVIRERVMVAVATHRDRSLEGIFTRSELAPSYPAYLAFVEGFWKVVQGDLRGATADLLRANELSPDFVSPLIPAGFGFILGWGDFAKADSVARVAEASKHRLPRYDRLRLELLRAVLDGDHHRAYRAAKEASAILPGGSAHYASSEKALHVNRPGETLEILAAFGLKRDGIRGFPRLWDTLTQAHHLVEDHHTELREARRGRRGVPDLIDMTWVEVRALASLGRVPELLGVLDECLGQRWTDSANPGRVMVGAVEELQVHGFETRTAKVLERFHTWHDALSPGERSRADLRFDLGRALCAEQRFAEAREVFAELLRETPDHPESMRFLGTTAARMGDCDTAAHWSRTLAELPSDYLYGRHALGRAAIAARIGDAEGALSLLQQAVSQGLIFGTALHADPDLYVLRDVPGYREFMRPRG
jgi:DNA-binding SARP family transcriptional activator